MSSTLAQTHWERGRDFLFLAAPMIVSRAGLAAMGIADGVMVANYEAREFAWLSLAEGTLGRLLDVCVALLIGALAMVPRSHAGGDAATSHKLWRRTLPAAIGLGLLGVLAGWLGTHWLALFGQSAELASGAGSVLRILGLSFPASLLAISAAVYLEGTGRARFVAICVVMANVFNLLLNWMLISGHSGFLALGARGSAWSTTSVRIGLAIALVTFAWRDRGNSSHQQATSDDAKQSLDTQWRLALGSAATIAVSLLLTASLTIFAGWMGAIPLAAFSGSWILAAPGGLMALGFADAAGIRVASTAGSASETEARRTAWWCLRVTLTAVLAPALLLTAAATTFARWYSNDGQMQTLMAGLLPLTACVLMADTVGFVLSTSLRSLRDAVWPACIEAGSMLVLAPCAYWFSQKLSWGIRGLFLAALTAALVRAAFLIGRMQLRPMSPLHTNPETDDWMRT